MVVTVTAGALAVLGGLVLVLRWARRFCVVYPRPRVVLRRVPGPRAVGGRMDATVLTGTVLPGGARERKQLVQARPAGQFRRP